jgi:hypothetical protein
MTTPTPNYDRSILTGTVAWVVSIAVLHWLPLPIRIDARFTPRMGELLLGNSIFFAVVVYRLVRRKPAAERFPAAAAIVMPVAFGDGVAMAFFPDFFPTLSPDAGAMFAAFLLLTSAVILATGFAAGLRNARV